MPPDFFSSLLEDGTAVTRERLTALGQAKVAYAAFALGLARGHGAQAFASILPQRAPRPATSASLRKDYAYLFERFYTFLINQPGDPMGYLVFDELDKSASHVLLGQVGSYFIKTQQGRTRSRLIIPEPFFVHSDLTTLIQVADIIAYAISWGLRLKGMTAPKRDELDPVVGEVLGLCFRHQTGTKVTWGYKLINDLRPAARGPRPAARGGCGSALKRKGNVHVSAAKASASDVAIIKFTVKMPETVCRETA